MIDRAPSPIKTPGDPEVTYTSLPVRVLAVGERRLDGETYLTSGHALRLHIEQVASTGLGDVAEIWQPSRLKGISVAPDHGAPFLAATQLFDIRPVARKWLAPSRTPEFEKRFLHRDWILVTCSGTVGDVILTYTPHLNVLVSHDLLRVQPKDADDLGYLYVFLRSKYGRAMMRSSHYGSVIKHLEPEHLAKLPVPRITDQVRRNLNERVGLAFRLRDEAFQLVEEAEARYAAELGTELAGEQHEAAHTFRAFEMFGGRRRLDGHFYNPAAEAALHTLEESGRPVLPLSSVVHRIFGVPRFKHVYGLKGTPYLDSEDIFKINPVVTKFIPRMAKTNASAYFVKRRWLLMACSGQLYGLNGSVILANEWHEDKIVSNHVIRIVPRADSMSPRPGYLQVVLGHPVLGRPLVLRLAFGTEVPEISPDDLVEFPVPRLDAQTEKEIADMAERASELRLQADREENEAVRVVEWAVERVLPRSSSRRTPAADIHKRTGAENS